MKKLLFILLLFTAATPALAGDKEHLMKVHGAVCPACAYGLEKKFMKIEGVKAFDVDFKSGIVSVCAEETITFSEEQLATMFKESGYTFKGEEIKDTCTI